MSVIEIRQARREGARLVFAFAGISGSGKTYTAIEFGYGLANYDASKLGVLDTENRRGSLYSDILRDRDGNIARFLIGDLYAPFSPQRYIDAIHEFQRAGVEVLVIDSVSHEWEGLGGCWDIAHDNGKSKRPNWLKAKAEHKRFVNVLLQCDMHVIVCVRAREKFKPTKVMKDGRETEEWVSLGFTPIQESNFMFEMTASLMMWDAGRSQQVLKPVAELRGVLGREKGYITAEDGLAVRRWVDGAVQLDPKVEKFRNRLQSVTEQGVAFLTECWAKTPADVQKALGDGFKTQVFAAAHAFDAQRAAAAATDTGPDEADDLNEALGLAGGEPAEEEYADD